MNFVKLKYFLAVAEELNISRAAERLFITQQALSSQISQLEQHYGVRLFNRRPVFSLTPEGLCLQKKAKKILQLEQEFIQEADSSSPQYSGVLKIGYSSESSSQHLSNIFSAYHSQYPLMRFTFIHGTSQQLWDMLTQGCLDFIMDYYDPSFLNMQTIHLSSENLCLLYRRDLYNPASINFSESPLLLLHPAHYLRKALNRYFRRYNITPQIQAESNDLGTLVSLCRCGAGITFCPESVAVLLTENTTSDELAVSPLPHTEVSCSYVLGYMDESPTVPSRAFIHTVTAYFKADGASNLHPSL